MAEEIAKTESQDLIAEIDETEEARLLGLGDDEADNKSEIVQEEEDKDKITEDNDKLNGEEDKLIEDENKLNGEDKIDCEKSDNDKTEVKENDKADESKAEEKGTTETIMEIDGKKVKKTTGGSKKVPPSSVYKSSDRESQRRDRKKRAVGMRRRTLLICNVTLEDMLHEKVKGVLESCYHCQIRFLQTKIGKRGIVECRFNTLEDATKAEEDLKEIAVEERTIGIRNLEDNDAPSTWYEVGKELDRYMKGVDGKDGSDHKDGEKGTEKQKDAQEDELAAFDESKTLVLLNLPLTTTEEMLQAIFSEAQKISMPLDNTGQCKGHAFLEFETAEMTTECQTKYEGISIEDDKDDRQIYIQSLKEYKEKSKARAERARRRSGSRTRSRDDRDRRLQMSRRLQMNRMKRGLPLRSRGRVTRGRDRNWIQSSPRNMMTDRKRDGQGSRRDRMGQNMLWNSDMLNNMPNLLNMMGGMNASMMGMNPFMGNMMNFQAHQDSNRNMDNDYNRNRKRKSDEQDFYRGDNRRGGGSAGGGNWKNRRYDNQDSYGSQGGSYADRDRGNRGPNRDRNVDNRGFRRSYY